MPTLKQIFIGLGVIPAVIGLQSQADTQLPAPVAQQASVVTPRAKEKIADALNSFLTRHPEAKHLVLGEDHKNRLKNYDLLSDPKVISVFKSHGMHTLAIESPAGFQNHVEDVMWNNLDPEKYAAVIVQEYINIGEKEEKLQDVRESYK